ncbi:MAG TPA: hypothetical protein VK633_09075, partial [Verrucomicrobiae bacterium]|nr:hypothetical protein [Verrucomicrobiae bacterium]
PLKNQGIKIQRPGTPDSEILADAEGVLRDVPLDRPGIYSLKDKAGGELRRIAVNLPSTESDLSFLPPADIEQQLVRQAEPTSTTLSASLFGNSPQGKDLWRLLLGAALCFLIIEPLVANRTVA